MKERLRREIERTMHIIDEQRMAIHLEAMRERRALSREERIDVRRLERRSKELEGSKVDG